MRTLFEIISAAKSGEPTTHEECLYALLAYSALSYFDKQALRRLAFFPSPSTTPGQLSEESRARWKRALRESPRSWLGVSHDPANDEYCKRVMVARSLMENMATDGEREPGEDDE